MASKGIPRAWREMRCSQKGPRSLSQAQCQLLQVPAPCMALSCCSRTASCSRVEARSTSQSIHMPPVSNFGRVTRDSTSCTFGVPYSSDTLAGFPLALAVLKTIAEQMGETSGSKMTGELLGVGLCVLLRMISPLACVYAEERNPNIQKFGGSISHFRKRGLFSRGEGVLRPVCPFGQRPNQLTGVARVQELVPQKRRNADYTQMGVSLLGVHPQNGWLSFGFLLKQTNTGTLKKDAPKGDRYIMIRIRGTSFQGACA